jgi:hypothetical protein
MTPEKPPDTRNQADMFRSRLDNILNTRHPVFKLAGKIDWSVFEKEFGALYVEKVGRPGQRSTAVTSKVGLLLHAYRQVYVCTGFAFSCHLLSQTGISWPL